MDDRDQLSSAPFEDFPGALIEKTGNVVFEGQVVGRLIEGDAKKLAGKTVDPDGEVIDRGKCFQVLIQLRIAAALT